MDLVLASTSPYRRELLARLGVAFRCLAPQVDEEAIKRHGLDPQELAAQLALAKATSLCDIVPHAIVIGCDQLVEFEGQIFGKPGSVANAEEQLAAMAGKSHQLVTALAVRHARRTYTHNDVTTLHMRPLTRVEIARYVAADQPLDCAGSYKLEARGIVLFERIESRDHTATTGLPLIALTSILRGLEYRIP
jgi:7-methyl-GTP pyrophosphatase